MIIVHGTIPLRPESRDKALELARRMARASVDESGCVSYDFYLGLLDQNVLMLFQEWESMDALRDHFRTAHMETFLRELPDLLDGKIVTRRFAVQSVDETEGPSLEDSQQPTVH